MALRTRIWPGRRPAAICVCLFFGLFGALAGPNRAGAAGLADSPWPMFQHDPQHTGRSPVAAPSKLGIKWRFQVQGNPASPVIGPDGTIYVPTGDIDDDPAGFLYAINPDGTLRWRFAFPPSPETNCVIVPGVTTPAIADDGTVYVHTQSGRTIDGSGHCTAGPSFLYAINPDGSEKCKYQFNFGGAVFQSSGISSPAIGPDGTVYVTSLDTGLHAINPADCTFDWIVSPEATSISSSPAIGTDGTIYFMIADLYAYEPDGDPKWTAETGSAVPNNSSPSIGADGTIYACGLFPDACHAVSPAGSVLWSFPLELPVPGWGTPAIAADGAIYLPARDCQQDADSCVYAINPDGSQRWRVLFPFGGAGVNHSVIVGGDGRVYTRGDLGVGAGGFFGSLYVLNPADGSESDRRAIPAINQGSGELNPAIGSDGTLYVPEPHNAGVGVDPHDQYLAAYTQASGGPGPADTNSPNLRLRGRQIQRLDASVEVGARCDEDCSVTGTGVLIISVPPREGASRVERKRVRFRLRRDSRQATQGETVTLKLRVPRKARGAGRAALRDFRSVIARMSVVATDTAGNESRKKRRITFTGGRG